MLDINPLFNAGHFKEAEALARHELEATPGQLHANLILGKVLLRRGALAEALRKIVDVDGRYICNDGCESIGTVANVEQDRAPGGYKLLHASPGCGALCEYDLVSPVLR